MHFVSLLTILTKIFPFPLNLQFTFPTFPFNASSFPHMWFLKLQQFNFSSLSLSSWFLFLSLVNSVVPHPPMFHLLFCIILPSPPFLALDSHPPPLPLSLCPDDPHLSCQLGRYWPPALLQQALPANPAPPLSCRPAAVLTNSDAWQLFSPPCDILWRLSSRPVTPFDAIRRPFLATGGCWSTPPPPPRPLADFKAGVGDQRSRQ